MCEQPSSRYSNNRGDAGEAERDEEAGVNISTSETEDLKGGLGSDPGGWLEIRNRSWFQLQMNSPSA